jgi:hypothetical protein
VRESTNVAGVVELDSRRSGAFRHEPFQVRIDLVGKTSSNKKGHWKVDVMAHSGKYFAQVPAQKIMTTHCAKARSTTVDVMQSGA